MRTGFLIRLFFVMLATTMLPICLMAQWDGGRVLPTISSKLIGASIAADSFSISMYSPMGEDERKITNIISFYIREVDSARTFFASPFTATVNFDLELTINGQVSTQPAKTLVVNFDTTTGISYNVRAYIVLPEAASVVKLTVQNLTISGGNGWNPSAVLQLDNDIQVSQYFHSLGPTTFSPGSFIAETETESLDRPDELKVSWMWAHEHYNLSQLEWAFIDSNMLDNYSYDLENPGNIFTNNGTRVDIDFGKETYQIPLLYPSGNLFFRVRPVLRKSNGNLITGPWSPAKLYAVNGHEGNLNWQSSTGFAENAKLKTVVQYFDGSLRSRQSVTKDNGSKNTVVAETIYDLQGRPNIQILPTPALANTIHYFKDFNRFVGQQSVGQGALSQYEDPAKYFDLSLVACAASPALDTTTGTGKYYSGNNDWLSIESKAAFIPNAHGYAYTETRFMDDASERVRSQGGVGPSHQLGSGNETKYWYGKPSQAELDALFGTEAGVASHYGKNMVQDPNQQLSVHYIDMQGRTVATALAGGTVAGMQDISNSSDYPKAGLIYDSLLTCETNIVKQRSVESVSTILVVAPNTKYDFVYELEPAMLRLLNCDSQQVCFDCKYDLEISIKSEACGDSLPRIRRFNNLQPMQPFTCDSAVGFSGEGFSNARRISFSDTLSIGSYIIRKTLTINDSIYELRRQDALSQFLCSTEQQLYDSIYASLQLAALCNDEQSANNTCDSCKTSVSNFAEYRTRYLSSLNISPANVDYDSAIRRYYISNSLECASACGNIRQELGSLQNYRQQLLDDMAAGSGQYGVPVSEIKRPGGTATDLSLAEAKYNIFSDTYILHGIPAMRVPYYLEPLLEDGRHYYLNIDDWPDSSVHGHISTGQQILDTVTAPTFTNLFQQQWSNSLVTRHPEYQLLQFAETYLRPAFEWLDKVEQCDTYQQAVDSGYLNPLNLANEPYPSQGNDPFFILPGNTTAKAMIATRIFDGVVIDNNSYRGPSIWQLANATVLCSTKDSLEKPGCILSQLKDRLDPLITDPAEKNKAWEHFRTLYLGFRYDLVMSYITSRFPANKPDLDSLLHQGKQLRFATLRQLGQQHEWRNFSALLDGETASLAQLASVTDTTDRCKAQRPIWKAQLLQCESLVALLATGTSSDQIKVYNILNQILDGMELVCVNSTSPQHPYGASNVNPTFAGYPKNFEQVIHSVFANNGIDTAASTQYFCNAYSIGFPKPLGLNPPLFANATNVIDTCACSQFVKLKQQANNLGFDTLTLTGTRSMNQFFREQFEDSISAIIWNGLQQCNKPLFKDTCFVVPGVDSTAVPVCQNCSPDTSVCGKPILYSVNYINTGSVNNVKLNIRTSSGTFNCKIIATNLVTNAITYFTIDSCGAFTDTISLPPLERYSIRVSVGSIHGLCYDSSDAHILSASRNVCKTMYVPIYMPEVIELPAFFSCDYKKPCLSCGSFQSYTQEFRQLFPAFSAVPYALSGAITAAQQEQNHLWARFINYRAGLNKTSADYLAALETCSALNPCTPTNILDDLLLTMRSAPFPGEYVAKKSIQLNPGFQSSTGDTYLIYIDTKVDTCASNGTLVALCESFHPVNNSIQSLLPDTNRCRAIETRSLFITKLLLEKRRDSLLASFDDQYLSTCMGAKFTERFFVSHVPAEYHYTLYYYNQAGNLVKTLPPAGVKPNYAAAYLDSVKQFREAGLDHSNYLNNVALASEYRYNSLNQVISQLTPDAGQSHFWYDRLGRLAVSQNAKQRLLQAYSYTLYDELGRIIEVAEKEQISPLTQAISGSDVSLQAWLAGGGDASQITRTAYDEAFLPLASSVNGSSGLYQKNLRNRVSYTYVKEHGDQSPGWDAASFYSYDIHGNVDTLLQDYKTGMGAIACTTEDIRGNRFKKVAYNYDLLSGKVNEVAYQPGQSDQFFHRYSYDAENRLQSVQTSKDKQYWEQDASYDYYRHGPLARTVLGNNQVQGPDFAYTIQGWLKGINSTAISTSATSFDMGSDGIAGSLFARDAFGFGLNYFRQDYQPIKAALSPFTKMPGNLPAGPATSTGTELFNGNISAMAVNLPLLGAPKVYGYQYDQLNRLVNMDAFTGLSNADNTFTPVRTDDYHEAISYDPNGNIRSYLRNGAADNGKPLAMDNLTYQYEKSSAGQSTSNRLRYVHEQVADGNYTTDIDSHKPAGFSVADVAGDINNSQPGDNYAYDAVGNLVKDTKEGITTIEWTVYGKIKSIVKSAERIDYTYDASGNRISKSVTAGGIVHSTFYVRDATGNVLSIYTWQGSAVAATTIKPLTQTEIHLYGSGRLGIFNTQLDVQNCLNPGDPITIFKRGNKFFELSNHLGNVLATISDKKIGSDGNNDGAVDFYQADVVTANDYYPFGMQMPGRKYSQPHTAYRYGFNGRENDNEIKGEGNQQDYGMRIYDLRLAKFLSVDPITAHYPELTPYQFASNRPIDGIDMDGLEYVRSIPHFYNSGNRTLFDYVAAFDNGVIDVLNTIPTLWNSGVSTVQSIKRGSYGQDVKRDFKQVGRAIKQAAVAIWNSPLKTLTSPEALEIAVSTVVGAKVLPTSVSKGNLLKPVKSSGTVSLVEGSYDYYLNIAKNGDFATAKNSAVFYSGPGQRSLAQEFVANNSGKVTIEGTVSGNFLDGANLYKKFTQVQADAIWAEASKVYTNGVTGEATAFVKGAEPTRQYLSLEKPILIKKKDIKLIEKK